MKYGNREPLFHLVKRDGVSVWRAWAIRLIAFLASLVICGLIIFAIVKLNPLKVYAAMWEGAFGTNKRVWVTIRDSMALLCIGVGLAPAFKLRFWNIGAEGQILAGGIATAACMIYLKSMPTGLLFLVMAVSAVANPQNQARVPALFKARWNTNETLFTLMMNYIAIQLTSFFVSLWENPYGSNSVGVINQTTRIGWFSPLFGQQYMLNVVIVMSLTIGMYIYLRSSKQGYEIAVAGESVNTAKYIGISVKRVIIRTMVISGGICGVAGFVTVAGAGHTISTSTAGGRGFTAIIVAWLAKFNTFVMILIAALLVFLEKGAMEIASRYNLSDYASQMITGIILFFILGSEFFINYRVLPRKKTGGEGANQ